MPIKVTCQCGKSFAAKDELAGKAVKCPNCQQPLRIPGAAQPAAKSTAQPAAKGNAQPAAAKVAAAAPAKAAAKPASASSSGIGLGDEVRARSLDDSLLSEVGLHQQAANTRPCPGCMAPMGPDAVVCIKCGYNTKLGRRMQTVSVTGGGGPEGHSAIAEELLQKAADSIEEQKDEDRKKTAEGVPLYAYALALAAVIGFCVMMSFIPQGVGMLIAGLVIIVLSFVVVFYAWVRGLIEAFMYHPLLGLGIFFGDIALSIGMAVLIYFDIAYVSVAARFIGVPILWTIFVIANWEICGIYMNMMWFAMFLRWIGLAMLILGAMMAVGNQNNNAALPPPPPAAVGLDLIEPATTASADPSSLRKADFDATEPWDVRVCAQPVFDVCRVALRRRADETRAEARGRCPDWPAAA